MWLTPSSNHNDNDSDIQAMTESSRRLRSERDGALERLRMSQLRTNELEESIIKVRLAASRLQGQAVCTCAMQYMWWHLASNRTAGCIHFSPDSIFSPSPSKGQVTRLHQDALQLTGNKMQTSCLVSRQRALSMPHAVPWAVGTTCKSPTLARLQCMMQYLKG